MKKYDRRVVLSNLHKIHVKPYHIIASVGNDADNNEADGGARRMQSDAVVTTVRGEKVTVADVIVQLKLKGVFRSTIYELIEHRVIEQAANQFGVAPSSHAVDLLAQKRRHELGVADDDTFERYLKFHGVGRAAWLRSVRLEAVREALKAYIVTPRRLTEAYKRDPERFASVSIARILCRSRADAERVCALGKSGDADFLLLARDYCTDENARHAGGYIGAVNRGILPAEVEAAAFAAQAGDVVGPFREHGVWTVYKVHAVHPPKLTDGLKAVLSDQIFAEWLREQVCTVPA